jgi:catechol 2,3-dioxygenase-like lactoylglutathione lyase family enzyme
MQTQLSHLQFNVRPENMPFYADLLAYLGWKTWHADAGMLGVGDKNGVSLWFVGHVKEFSNDYDGPGMNHLAIGANSPGDVDQAAAYLTGRDVELLFETPRHRPEFSQGPDQTYYQIMFETPDRILVEIVYIGPKAA